MYPKCLLLFAFLAILGCYANDEIKDFLSNSGSQNLETNFVSEEIEVRHIPSLPDHLLAELGVRTMGARLRIRSAATQWLQVAYYYCLSFVKAFYLFTFSLAR